MALGATDLVEIAAVLDAQAEPAGAVADLRRRFPALTVTRCDPSDLDLETPFHAGARFSLYLVDSTDHCWRLTSDAARATGLVVVAHQAGA
jgi:hypothetical protein